MCKRLLVTFGGSHRQYNRTIRIFQNASVNLEPCGAASLGSKLQHGIMPDTAEARLLLKQCKGSIARKQWEWLSRSD